MVQLEQRTISGLGLLKVPKDSDDFKEAKVLTLFVEVVRKATNEYLNLTWPIPRSRYANLLFMRTGHVIRVEPLEFEKQLYDTAPQIEWQTAYAVQCAYAGMLQSFSNLALLIQPLTGVFPISITDNIKDWVHIDLFFDEVRVECYTDTAVKLTLEATPYDLCPEQETPEPPPPPPPPPPAPPVPPGTPIDISPPYDPNDPSEPFQPAPIDLPDEPPPPPEFPECTQLRVEVRARVVGGNNPAWINQTLEGSAPVSIGYVDSPNNYHVRAIFTNCNTTPFSADSRLILFVSGTASPELTVEFEVLSIEEI